MEKYNLKLSREEALIICDALQELKWYREKQADDTPNYAMWQLGNDGEVNDVSNEVKPIDLQYFRSLRLDFVNKQIKETDLMLQRAISFLRKFKEKTKVFTIVPNQNNLGSVSIE